MVSGKLISRPHWQGQVSERSWVIGRRLDSRGSLLDSRGSLVPLPTTAISSPPREILLEAAAESHRARPVSPRMAYTRPVEPQSPPRPPQTTTPTERIAATITDLQVSSSRSTPSNGIELGDVARALAGDSGKAADNGGAASPATASGTVREPRPNSRSSCDRAEFGAAYAAGDGGRGFIVGMSPRLEMRLALNQDIMNDEDLVNYGNGLELATILGHDLSSFQRRTGREMLNRSPQPRSTAPIHTTGLAGVTANSYTWPQPRQPRASPQQQQQNNSKMDTPTLSRRRASPSTWSSFASVDRAESDNGDETAGLSDLERLARHEKTMVHLRNGLRAAHTASGGGQETPPQGLTSTHSTPKRKTRALYAEI